MLDTLGSILGMVFPEGRKGCEHRSRAFRVILFDHDTTCNTFSRCSEPATVSFTYGRGEHFRQLWTADGSVTQEASI